MYPVHFAFLLAETVGLHTRSIDAELTLAAQAAGWPQLIYMKSVEECAYEACGEEYKSWVLPISILIEEPQCRILGWVQEQIN